MTKKQEQEEQVKEHQNITGAEIKVKDVEVLPSKNQPEGVFKVIFHTEGDPGRISWKPKGQKIEHRKGLKISRPTKILIDDLPEIVTKIAQATQKYGECTVLATYHLWNKKNDDGSVSHIRFVQGKGQLDEWSVDNSDKEQIVK